MAKRIPTNYPGVYYRMVPRVGGKGLEKSYYVTFKRDGKKVEEAVGRQYQDDMTPAKANGIRGARIEGRRMSRAEVRKQEQAVDEKWTIARIAEHYFENRREGKAKVVDRLRYDKYIEPVFGKKEPSEIIKLDTDRLRIRLQKKLSPQTTKHVLNLLVWICNYGFKCGYVPALTFKVQRPAVDNIVTEDLNDDQMKRLIAAIDAEPDVQVANFMRLILFTGMRRGELFKLKWKHIDWDRGFINIIDPKGGPSQRIPLNEAAGAILADHPRTQGTPYVFPGRGGKRRVSIANASRRVRDAAGLPKNFRPCHGLRHAFASGLASSGKVDLFTLGKLLTHKSTAMTARYAHLRDQALRNASDVAVDVIEKIANGK